jgi:hypothetical protein
MSPSLIGPLELVIMWGIVGLGLALYKYMTWDRYL